jgi:lysozyme
MKDLDQAGFDFLRAQEGCRLEAYQDQAGKWTIGYGCTGEAIVPGLVISQAQADDLLRTQAQSAIRAINRFVMVPITQNQFNALVSLCYNIGRGNFMCSTLLRKLNDGDFRGAAKQFLVWDKRWDPKQQARVEDRGILARREREKALFESDFPPELSPEPSATD